MFISWKIAPKCLLIFIALSWAIILEAQVRIVKEAGSRDPSVSFRGVSGDSKLSAMVASDLRNCGWFNMSAGKGADYIISGKADGVNLTLSVFQGNGSSLFSFKAPIDRGNPSMTVHKLVDTVLNKICKVQICSSKIAFCVKTGKNTKEIYTCDFDGKNAKRLTSNRTLSVEPTWTPGKKSVIYTMYSKGLTNVVETFVASRRSRRLVQYPGLNSGAAVSPNGKVLALLLSKDRTVELYVKSINTRWKQRLTNSSAVEASPCWSPSGQKICFVSDVGGRPGLYLISSRGGQMQKLPTYGSEAVSPDWSSDNKIVYSAKMGRNYTLAILDLSGKNQSGIIVNAAGDWESPSWAPDNRHVVCSRTLNGISSIYVIDTWTKKIKPLFTGKSGQSFSLPDWSGI